MIPSIQSIDQLTELWRVDAPMDELDMKKEIMRISILHSKYLGIMTRHNLIVQRLKSEYAKERKFKWEYFIGYPVSKEELQKRGMELDHKKILRQDVQGYLDSDNDLSIITLKIAAHTEIVEFCKYVLKELNSRTYQCRSIIDIEKLTLGN